jgi:hypothetical protein
METRQKKSSIDSSTKIIGALGFLRLGAIIREIAANDNSDDDPPPKRRSASFAIPQARLLGRRGGRLGRGASKEAAEIYARSPCRGGDKLAGGRPRQRERYQTLRP